MNVLNVHVQKFYKSMASKSKSMMLHKSHLRNISTDLLNVGMDGMENPLRTSVWFELMLDLTSMTSAVCTAAECSRAAKV